jgi:putative hydroxymethylpyrimidine transport system substrate-binding protein
MRSKLMLTALALLAALALAACGEKTETVTPSASHLQNLTVMLDWFPNADHVGLYRALAEGDFRQVGLNVKVQTPSDPSLPLKLLAAGKVDLAISYEPEVLLARNQNLPLISIAAIVQRPLTSIVSVGRKHITSVADLRGKTVGDAGIPYQHAYLQTILAHAGIPASSVHEVDVGDNLVPAMLSGRVDATLGAFWNYEAIQLAELHKHPNVIHIETAGVPTYDELVLVATQTTINRKTDLLRRFVQALGRGYASARANPRAAVADLVAANPGLDRSFQLAAVNATLPAFFPAGASQPWGAQDSAQWTAFGNWMASNHLISNPLAIQDAESNDFLAGVGP